MPPISSRWTFLMLASAFVCLPVAAQSVPDWAAPSQATQDPNPPGFPGTPGPTNPPGFPGTPGFGDPPGFPSAPGPSAPPGFPGSPEFGPEPPQFPNEPASVPLDGGLVWLALAGGAYAAKRLRDQADDDQT